MLSLFRQLWLLPFIITIAMLYAGKKKNKNKNKILTSLVCPIAMMKSKKGSSPPCWAGEFSWTCKAYSFFYYCTWICGYTKWHGVNLYTWFNIYFWPNQKRDTKWQTLGSSPRLWIYFFTELRTTGGRTKLPNIGTEHLIRKKHCDAECKAWSN